MEVEIEVERQLCLDGYLPATRNEVRAYIRDLLFYTKSGKPISEWTLEKYLTEMSTDFYSKTPFQLLMKARGNYTLALYNTKREILLFFLLIN